MNTPPSPEVFQTSPLRHRVGLIGAAAVLLIGLFLPDPFARWFCVSLGLIGLAMGAAKYVLSPCLLTLDDDGMTIETPLRATRIRWRYVKSLNLQRTQQNKLIVVRCAGRWQGWRPFNANKAHWVERDYFVPNLFDAPLEEILLLCEQRLERAGNDQPDVQALRP